MRTEVITACGHNLLFTSIHAAPKHGETVFCIRCDDFTVSLGAVGQHKAICAHCSWRKERAKLPVLKSQIEKHLTDEPDHAVIFVSGDGNTRFTIRSGQHSAPLQEKG